jgi:hypothetical protein
MVVIDYTPVASIISQAPRPAGIVEGSAMPWTSHPGAVSPGQLPNNHV